MLKVAALCILPALCQAFFWSSGPAWDGLIAKWGNPFTALIDLPRTRAAAIADGWSNMAPSVACDGNPLFRGERYIKDGDLGVILVFDPAGYIAGIQTGIRQDYPNNVNNYPSESLIGHPFILDGGVYYITAYFREPASVCNGRTARQFEQEGTGLGLWIQNGSDPVSQSFKAPSNKRRVENSHWTKGKCFYTMGQHYWYNITTDMSCEDFFPVFLMYNDDVLDSFGWAFGMNIVDSEWLEHPPQAFYGNFLDPVPTCLYDKGTMTSLHIFLHDSPTFSFC